MERLRSFRGAGVTIALLVALVASSQLVDFRRLPDLGPSVFTLTPEGAEVARLSPITVTFATPPSERAPESLMQLVPSAAGSYAWLSSRTLLFQPDFPGLLRGSTYTVIVPARPEAGLPDTVARKFTVTGKLAVQQIIPGTGDTEVPLNAQVLVQFNRSVAPLTTLSNRPTGAVVTFDPPLQGTGEWLNTSIYRFVPTDLVPTTTYKVTIAKGLSSAVDGVLEQDFRSTFTTIEPAVDSIVPDAGWIYGGPWQEVVVTFNQAMSDSAAAGVTVANAATGAAVAGRRSWNDGHTVLTFNPTARMDHDTKYTITVNSGLSGARGGTLAHVRTASFTTVGLPSVKQTFPADGDGAAGRFGVNIQFTTPMDPSSLDGKLSVSGFTDKDLEGKVNVFDTGIGVNVALEPRTRYTVTLAPGATDRYGQALGGFRFSFTTGSLPSSVSLALPGYGGAATYSASAEPFLFFQTTNKPTVTFSLYPLTGPEAKSTMHDFGLNDQKWTPSQAAIRTWTEKIGAAKDEVRLGKTSLSGGGPLPRGAYLLATDSGQNGLASRFVFAVVDTVIVTKLSFDELLVWALDHDTGKPLAGVNVHADGAGLGLADAITDDRGLATFSVPKPVLGLQQERSYYLTIGGERNGVLSTRWQGLSPFQFGLPAEFYAREWVGHIYADRPIYRPGETFFYKGIIRADDDAQYSLPPKDGPFQFVLRNARGQQLEKSDVRLDDFGSFSGFFDIPADAPTGDYFYGIEQKNTTNPTGGFQIAGNSFLVSEFRTPEFQVEVQTDRPSYVSGDTIAGTAAASFFFGGALAGAQVDWSALSDFSYAMRVKGFESYSFSDFDYYKAAVARDAIRAKGSTTTGANGTASFSVPAVLNATEGPQRFTVSATVTDQSAQAVAGSTQVIVHPAALYAGIRATQYVVSAGADATVQLVSVDTEGKVMPAQNVVVRVYDRQWITTKVQIPGGGRRYQSDVRDVLLQTLAATTDASGAATVTYRPTKPGQLRLVAEVTDARGRSARSATYLWVWGTGNALWQVTNDDTIKLVADKPSYQVGDTAEVLVPAPFSGATALITIERGKIITREVRALPTNSERLRIPITDRSVPDVFVSVVLYRAPTDVDPLPRYKVGYVELIVSTQTRQLKVKITPNTPQAMPGQTVHYDIKVTDIAGKGVRSEVSVAVVDKAVLSLLDERGSDGLRAFWFERGLAVNTTSSMTNSLDRWNDVVAVLPNVGKGGSGSGLQTNQARQDFRNTAYWEAQLVSKDDGTAGVDVKMPDNLTTWRLQARAISGDTMVGEGTNELVSTKPILIRSALPRFLRVGDAVDLRVLVRNATTTAANVAVALRARGVDLPGPLSQTHPIAPDGSVAYIWPAKVSAEGTVTLTFTATGGAQDDAMAVTLPAYIDLTPEATATNGIVTTDAGIEAIYLPKFADTAHGSLNVAVRSALVGSLTDELPYFKPYAGEAAEWVASRLIATIGVARAEKGAGGTNAYAGRIASDLAGLIGRQRPDGGWAWCDDPICSTDPNVTGWVLLALGEGRRDGSTIDSGVVARAASYVFGYVNRSNTSADGTPNDRDQKAFLLAALAASGGQGVLGLANALLDQDRTSLSAWGRAYLLNAFLDAGATVTDAPVKLLLGDLAATTIPSANGNHWESSASGAGPSSKTSLLTSTSTTALVALAIARAQPEHQLLAQSVRWLVVARSAGAWQTSIDRAMSILALTAYAVKTGELGAEYSYQVLLDDREVMTGLVQKGTTPTANAAQLSLTVVTPGRTSILSVKRDFVRAGRLYYTVELRYMTPAKDIESLNRGFAVSHTYTLLDAPSRPIASATLGDTVRVTVTVVTPNDRNYVTVEDLLPAGLEGIDARLKTVDPALRAKLEQDRTGAAQRSAGGYVAPWFRWYYSPWQQVDMRDDRAVLRAASLSKGVYEYVYYARATTTGSFFVAPVHAEETYFPEVFGRSDSARFNVTTP